MAIIGEYTVIILINGQPCKEYDGGLEGGRGPKKGIKYIEAISDAPYKIYVEVLRPVEEAVAFKISIDGVEVCTSLFETNHRRGYGIVSRIPVGGVNHSFSFTDIKRSKSSPKYSGWQLANLLFEAKQEDLLNPYVSDGELTSIGTILVEVHRYDDSEQTPTSVQDEDEESDFEPLQAQRKIPKEKSKNLT